jgi:hypothetical protein
MSDAQSSALTAARTSASLLEADQKRSSEEEAARFLQILGEVVQPALALGMGSEPTSGPTAAWRHGDSALTPAANSEISGTSESPEKERVDAVTLKVGAGELGEISVTAERGKDGLHLVIGLQTPELLERFMPERMLIVQAMQAQGLSVGSVSVVATERVGTVLAQLRGNSASPSSRSATSEASEKSKAESQLHKRRRRGIDVIG